MVQLRAQLRLGTRPTLRRPVVVGRRLFSSPNSTPPRRLTVLGIETSADDTCVCLLNWTPEGKLHMRSHKRVSCENVRLGGIHPVEAARSHQQNLSNLIRETMSSGYSIPHENSYIYLSPTGLLPHEKVGPQVPCYPTSVPPNADSSLSVTWRRPDLIAVTQGPGMGDCLNVGVATAKGLSVGWQVPIIGVHHMQAHALTPIMLSDLAHSAGRPWHIEDTPTFPFLSVLVSGKNTMLVHSKSITNYRILASTSTIALGDVLDKFAREILPKDKIGAGQRTVVYPKLMEDFVGPHRGDTYTAPDMSSNESPVHQSEHGWSIPPPVLDSRSMNYNFTSFNGHIQEILRARPDMSDTQRRDLAYDVMRIAFEHLISRVTLALHTNPELLENPPRHIVLSGGVASNMLLRIIARSMLDEAGFPHIRVIAPDPQWCTDNAAMIAYTGALMYHDGWVSNHRLHPVAKWPIEGLRPEQYLSRRPGWYAGFRPRDGFDRKWSNSKRVAKGHPEPSPSSAAPLSQAERSLAKEATGAEKTAHLGEQPSKENMQPVTALHSIGQRLSDMFQQTAEQRDAKKPTGVEKKAQQQPSKENISPSTALHPTEQQSTKTAELKNEAKEATGVEKKASLEQQQLSMENIPPTTAPRPADQRLFDISQQTAEPKKNAKEATGVEKKANLKQQQTAEPKKSAKKATAVEKKAHPEQQQPSKENIPPTTAPRPADQRLFDISQQTAEPKKKANLKQQQTAEPKMKQDTPQTQEPQSLISQMRGIMTMAQGFLGGKK